MRTVVLRGLATRRARTALSILAVVLGVALVSGALTLGGALKDASGKLKTSAYDGTAAVVSSPNGFTTDDLSANATIPARTLDKVRRTPGVELAAGEIIDEAKVIDGHGKPVGGGPYFGVGIDSRVAGVDRVSPFRLVHGRWATGRGQVVLDEATARTQKLAIGSTVRVAAGGPARTFTVSGIAGFGQVKSLGSATVTIYDLRTAQGLFGKPGELDDVLIASKPGSDDGALRRRLTATLGHGVAVQSARDNDRFNLTGLDQFVSIIEMFLIVFGAIAVLVGSMTIANALGLTVVQRARELALLRATGASRGQVLRSVVLEAGVIGAAGSLAGIAAGFGLAAGLLALMKSFGLELPTGGLSLTGGTVAVAIVTGLGTTLLASLGPAIRATHVAPVEALREGAGAATATARGRRSTIAGSVLALLGIGIVAYAMLASGLTTSERLISLAPGTLALLLGVAMLNRHAIVPLARLIGAPSARFAGVAGTLAQRNTMRNPRRTASTAAALMVGVALVTFVAVLASGLKHATTGEITDTIRSEQVIAGADGWSPVSPNVADAARRAGATTVADLVVDEARAYGKRTDVTGVDPAQFAKVYDYRWHDGSDATLRALHGDDAIVRRDFTTTHHLKIGSQFTVMAADGTRRTLHVRGIVDSSPIDPLGLGQVTIARPTFDRTFAQRRPKLVLVSGAPTAALDRALSAFPDAKRLTPSELADDVGQGIDSTLQFITVLLALAIVISVLGIVNTLALGVTERTRELGMLRAVGLSRRQLRRMVRQEGALTAMVGAALGIGIGLTLAAIVTFALADQGLRLVIPFSLLAGYVAAAGVAGVAAAAIPARRAGKLPVLAALAHE
jgi:putative ABC transport system permease protein